MKVLKFRPKEEIKAHADRLSVIAGDPQYSEQTKECSFNGANMLLDIYNGKWGVDDIAELGSMLQHKMDISEYGYNPEGILEAVDWVFSIRDFKELSTTEEYLRQLTDREEVASVSFYSGGSPTMYEGVKYRHIMNVYILEDGKKVPKSVYGNDILECIQKGIELLCLV